MQSLMTSCRGSASHVKVPVELGRLARKENFEPVSTQDFQKIQSLTKLFFKPGSNLSSSRHSQFRVVMNREDLVSFRLLCPKHYIRALIHAFPRDLNPSSVFEVREMTGSQRFSLNNRPLDKSC